MLELKTITIYNEKSFENKQAIKQSRKMDSPTDNITYRKPCRSSSLTTSNLSNITNSSEKAILDATMMSIPDSLHDNIGDLHEQIKNVTT